MMSTLSDNKEYNKERTKLMLRHSNIDYVGIELCAYTKTIIREKIKYRPLNDNLLEEIERMIKDLLDRLYADNENLDYNIKHDHTKFIVEYTIQSHISQLVTIGLVT